MTRRPPFCVLLVNWDPWNCQTRMIKLFGGKFKHFKLNRWTALHSVAWKVKPIRRKPQFSVTYIVSTLPTSFQVLRYTFQCHLDLQHVDLHWEMFLSSPTPPRGHQTSGSATAHSESCQRALYQDECSPHCCPKHVAMFSLLVIRAFCLSLSPLASLNKSPSCLQLCQLAWWLRCVQTKPRINTEWMQPHVQRQIFI